MNFLTIFFGFSWKGICQLALILCDTMSMSLLTKDQRSQTIIIKVIIIIDLSHNCVNNSKIVANWIFPLILNVLQKQRTKKFEIQCARQSKKWHKCWKIKRNFSHRIDSNGNHSALYSNDRSKSNWFIIGAGLVFTFEKLPHTYARGDQYTEMYWLVAVPFI